MPVPADLTRVWKIWCSLAAMVLAALTVSIGAVEAQEAGVNCSGTLIPTLVNPATGVEAGHAATVSFVTESNDPAFDLLATIVETNGTVEWDQSGPELVFRHEANPMTTTVMWEFLEPGTETPMTLRPAILVSDLDGKRNETVTFPAELVEGALTTDATAPEEDRTADTVAFRPDPLGEAEVIVDLAETSAFSSSFSSTGSGSSGFRFVIGCSNLALDSETTPSESAGSPDVITHTVRETVVEGSSRRAWLVAAVFASLGALATVVLWRKLSRQKSVAETDPLTGAYNRLAIDRRLRAEVGQGGSHAVLKIDVDKFKDVNDTYGHGGGDAVLCAIVDRARSHLRSQQDAVIRLGGDEFLVVLTRLRDPQVEAIAIAERLAVDVRKPVISQGSQILPSISIGVAYCDSAGDIDAMIADADLVLYRAKALGRNQVQASPVPS